MAPSDDSLWNQIDHELANLRICKALEQVSQETRDRIEALKRQHSDYRTNPGRLIREIHELLVRQERKKLDAIYGTLCEVWQLQRNKITPQFARAAKDKIIETHPRQTAENIRRTLSRALPGIMPPQSIEAFLYQFEAKTKGFERAWLRDREIEARELEHKQGATQAADGPGQGVRAIREQTVADAEAFNQAHYGGVAVCLAVSYFKAGQRDMRTLARALKRAHVKVPNNVRQFAYKQREKAKKNGWWDAIQSEYWKSYK